uniref:protein-tyrosine-phosphatase n=1 Tax=Oryzias latipes TaxID=8090 RepID=A0A3P9I2M3_ORYLA
ISQHILSYVIRIPQFVLRSESLQLKRRLGLTSEAGAQKENIKKNRYKDILPYDQCRVVLSLLTTESKSDYINATFVLQGATGDCKYVACQGPLGPTLIDFWRMIWQLDIKVRIEFLPQKKCECYWASVQHPAAFGPFTISNTRNVKPILPLTLLFLPQETRSVVQYQFVSWPDHDIPYETDGVLDLLRKVRGTQRPHSSPLLVHCSAGCGRTGVICALDYIYDLLVSKKITADFSIMKAVLALRTQRPSAVQTKVGRVLGGPHAGPQIQTCLSFRNVDSAPVWLVRTSLWPLKAHFDFFLMGLVCLCGNSIHSQSISVSFGRSLPFSHHYDNDPSAASTAPIYSTVKPRLKPHSLPPSATPIYDIAKPSIQSREGPEHHLTSGGWGGVGFMHLSAAGHVPLHLFSGFNCRVPKPKGPRNPPAQWSRLER